MDWEQQGVSLPPPLPGFDHPRMQAMQYHHHGGGGGRSRMTPFARSGSYGSGGGGHKQFYPPPQLPAVAAPPPPLPPPPPPPLPPQRKYEVLMEAGRLAAEYLVAKGVLPPASLQRRGVEVGSVRWGQPPPPPPPPLPQGKEVPAFYDARNGRRRFDDEYSNPNPRSRRSRGADYSGSNSSNHDGRRKRKFGAYNRHSDWGRDRERSRGYSESRGYDDEDDNAPPGYRRERRGSGVTDEVGSSVSTVAGEGRASKAEAMGESELEDTGSKVSSSGNARMVVHASQEMEDENETNKMEENSKVSNSELVLQGMNDEGNGNNVSSAIIEEAEIKDSEVPPYHKVSDEKPDATSVLNEKVEDDLIFDEKTEDDNVSSVDNSLLDDCNNLLSYCNFTRIPTRPRSILAHRNAAPVHREIAAPEQVDLVSPEEVPQMAIDETANDSSLTDIHGDNKDDHVYLEQTNPNTACNQMVEQVEIEDMKELNNITQHYTIQENKVDSGISHTSVHQNSLKMQTEEGIPIYNIDTPPPDEVLIGSGDEGKSVHVELLPKIGPEASITTEEGKLGQSSSSFKICDLNLVGSPEVAEMRKNPRFTQHSSGCSIDVQNQRHVDFGITVCNNANNAVEYTQAPLENKAVQVIDIEDDSPVEASACDTSETKSEMIYSSMENVMNRTVNTDVLPGIQDSYNVAISDFLGAEMPCYQPIQTDLQSEMGLNDSQGITVMDDAIYGSLSDIGFMEVWDQPSQDYEKFF